MRATARLSIAPEGPRFGGVFRVGCVRGPLTRRTVTGMASHTLRCTRCSQLVEHRSPFPFRVGSAILGGCDCGGDLRHADDTRGPVADPDGHHGYTPPTPEERVARLKARRAEAAEQHRYDQLPDYDRAIAEAEAEAAR